MLLWWQANGAGQDELDSNPNRGLHGRVGPTEACLSLAYLVIGPNI